MLLRMLKSKLHEVRVTESNVDYRGSITISREILEEAGMRPFEEVVCANFENSERFTTYIIQTDRPGVIGLNGPAARLGKVGDRLIVMTFGLLTEDEANFHQPRILLFDEENRIRQ